MITMIEHEGCKGFDEREVRIVQHYLEDFYHYRRDVHYILYEFMCEGNVRYSFYGRWWWNGNRYSRMFAKEHTLQPCASFNVADGSMTGKRGTKTCPVKIVEGVSYIADNYHPFYINHFVEVVE